MSKKALMIGLNYFNSPYSLNGCHNDIFKAQIELGKKGFTFYRILLDSPVVSDPKITKPLILDTIKGFFSSAIKGDLLVVIFSGHGGQVNWDSLERDKRNECIFDANFDTIIDNEINGLLIDNIKDEEIKVYFHFDSCHSGTMGDLPYNFIIKENRSIDQSKEVVDIGFKSSFWNIFERKTQERKRPSFITIQEEYKLTKPIIPEVFSLSGCKDSQTSADAYFEIRSGVYLQRETKAAGAMSFNFWNILTENPKITFYDLLQSLNIKLRKSGFDQRPQLSSSRKDLDLTTLPFWF